MIPESAIRDKIAASKKKGMWMGGPVPLGYDVVGRKLIINEPEAETVRLIFARHRTLQTIGALVDDLARRGVVSKRRVMRDGRRTGEVPYTRGAMAHLLRNVLYTGRVSHHGTIYPGEHNAILDQQLWEETQALMDTSKPRPRTGHTSLLNGMIQDGHGRPMLAAHAIRGDRRYRYYVSKLGEDDGERAWRLPAGDLEPMVVREIQALLRDPLRMATELGDATATRTTFASASAYLADRITDASVLTSLDPRIVIGQDNIEIELSARCVASAFGAGVTTINSEQRIRLSQAVKVRRRGHELRLIYAAPDANPAERDDRLLGLVTSGHSAWDELVERSDHLTTTRRSHLVRLARLRFLAPDIVTAIVDGRQPVELTSRTLLRIAELPMAWADQRRVLGFG